MHRIEALIYKFLRDVKNGPYKIPDELYQKFGRETQLALKAQFEREPRDFRLYMSSIGKPLCVLKFEKLGVQGESQDNVIRNVYGEIAEDIVLFLLHASGVPVIAEQERLEYTINGHTLSGRLDVVIQFPDEEAEVWDIKSASAWAFKNKFTDFEQLATGDVFGYVSQLFLYAEARRCKAGGFIAFDKSTGEVRVVEVPQGKQSEYRDRTIKDTIRKLDVLSNFARPTSTSTEVRKDYRLYDQVSELLYNAYDNKDKSSNNNGDMVSKCIEREYTDYAEYFRKVPTGNRIIGSPCTLCNFKWQCWPTLQLQPKAKSKAATNNMVYYTEYKELC